MLFKWPLSCSPSLHVLAVVLITDLSFLVWLEPTRSLRQSQYGFSEEGRDNGSEGKLGEHSTLTMLASSRQ